MRFFRSTDACIESSLTSTLFSTHCPGVASLPDHHGVTPREAARMGPYPRLCLTLLKEAERVNFLHKVCTIACIDYPVHTFTKFAASLLF